MFSRVFLMLGVGVFLSCNPTPSPVDHAPPKNKITERSDAISMPRDPEKEPPSDSRPFAGATVPEGAAAASAYPNELPGYTFYRDGELKGLVPLRSEYKDIVDALGEPDEASDIGSIGAPWAGFRKAEQPVLTYYFGRWTMLIYFVKTGYFEREHYPKKVHDKMFSIDLIPRNKLSFTDVRFPSVFKSERVMTEASFITMMDGSGLVYQMWAKDRGWGNLERISYGPPDRP